MSENHTSEGELRRCSDFYVTYYWTQPASGLHLYTNIVVIIISLLSSLLGSIANVLVILSYVKTPRLRTLSNIPLLSLAFSDLLVTALVLPLCITRSVKEIYGTHDCILWTIVRLASYFCAGVSLLTVTLISLERFITLAYPYRFSTILTRARMNITIASIWFLTFVVVVSHLGLIPYKIFLAISVTVVAICVAVLASIWAWVFNLIRNHQRKISTHQRPSYSSKPNVVSRRQTYKNTQTSSAIVLAFILCYLPAILMLIYFWTEPQNFVGIYLVTPWGETALFAHSVFNPLYVFWRKNEFRQTARLLIYNALLVVLGSVIENEENAAKTLSG